MSTAGNRTLAALMAIFTVLFTSGCSQPSLHPRPDEAFLDANATVSYRWMYQPFIESLDGSKAKFSPNKTMKLSPGEHTISVSVGTFHNAVIIGRNKLERTPPAVMKFVAKPGHKYLLTIKLESEAGAGPHSAILPPDSIVLKGYRQFLWTQGYRQFLWTPTIWDSTAWEEVGQVIGETPLPGRIRLKHDWF